MNKPSLRTVLFILFVSVIAIKQPFIVIAQEETDESFEEISSSSAELEDQAVQESIKDRIQQAVTKTKTDGVIQEDLAYVGTLETITDQSISIIIDGESKLISVDENTLIVDEDDEELTIEDLALESGVVVITQNPLSSSATATEIISLEEIPLPTDKKSVLVQTVSIDARNDILEMVIRPSDQIVEFELDRNSVLSDQQDEEIEIDEIEANTMAIVIYELDDDTNIVSELKLLSMPPVEIIEATASATSTDEP